MTIGGAISDLNNLLNAEDIPIYYKPSIKKVIETIEQEPKIKVLERDEVVRKLGAVDIYQAREWIILLNHLEYLGLKICEVEE